MFSNLIYTVISKIEKQSDFKIEKVNESIFEEFENLDLSLDLKRLFQWYWFSEDIEIGPTIYSAEGIAEVEKENSHLKKGILQIGDCPNGDEVFLQISDTSVLYWSHDESEDLQKDEKSLFQTYRRVEYFLINICNYNYIPWDSHSAREYFELYNGK